MQAPCACPLSTCIASGCGCVTAGVAHAWGCVMPSTARQCKRPPCDALVPLLRASSTQPLTAAMTSRGSLPSTLQPTDTAVPRISLQLLARSLAQLRGRMMRAISMMSDMVTLPLCLTFFSCSAQSRTGVR